MTILPVRMVEGVLILETHFPVYVQMAGKETRVTYVCSFILTINVQ